MNGWEVVLILLVPLGVWILSTVFKGEDDRPGVRPAGGRPTAQRRPATDKSDLERFLEEARRRRELAEKRQQPQAEKPVRPEPERKPLPVPAPERRPARAPTPPRRRQVEAPTARATRPPVLLQPVPDALPVFLPVQRVETPRVEPQPAEPVVLPVPTAATIALDPLPPPTRGVGVKTAPSQTLTQLAALLASPRTAGTAMILREVFDRPLSRRGR
jgi:hypothetical protein